MSHLTDNPLSAKPIAPVNLAGDTTIVPYEDRLNQDSRWALSEGSLFFERQGKVQTALARMTGKLNELGIPYALVGGMALFQHGYRRFTEDVDILVTREGLQRIHAALDGLGYVRPFAESKNLRDTEAGVKIEFLIAGQFPGDGKPKPVSFPDPSNVAIEINGMKVLNIPSIVELKLASGMSNPHRLKDLADVQELSKHVRLPANLADLLNPYVREKFLELCGGTPSDSEETSSAESQ